MASSFYSNSQHVDFNSVIAMDDQGMVSMFQGLMASGLAGFLGCPAAIYEAALVDFFKNASVREGVIISIVAGQLVEISEEWFAESFELPVDGLGDLSEIPKDVIFYAGASSLCRVSRWPEQVRRAAAAPATSESGGGGVRGGEEGRRLLLRIGSIESVSKTEYYDLKNHFSEPQCKMTVLPLNSGTCVTLNGSGIQLAVGPQPLRLRNHNSGLAHRIMYGPFNPYIPIRSTTIGKSRVAKDPIAMRTSWRSNSDIASVTSIGYPRMSASGESSKTMHRLLHASGSHPIPPPNDPKTNQYNQDLGLIHSTNGNHLESPNEGSSIDHQVTIYLHAQNITNPTNETRYFASQILVSSSGGLILILTAQSTRNMFRIHSDY
ncbi:hypothetical protein F511_16089 [Dorcoceras hygrometricum]|uniref:Dystroglycan-like n=1 Tax=Dorcoceras hygrometricum TaxID=472368 RepID=A0A2Z7BUG3_9LAMI|nr:hypothetical protein F511_16089 [Dorcoceras hygrometricum]